MLPYPHPPLVELAGHGTLRSNRASRESGMPFLNLFLLILFYNDMKESVWQRDITHEVLGVLAVFALVLSSAVATLGVATLGVDAQLAFAQHTDAAIQTAAAALALEIPPPPPLMMHTGSSTEPYASTTPAHLIGDEASSTALYCPKIAKTIARGGKDATTTGDVSELQRFIASKYNLDASSVVTGYFGSTTQAYLEKFQQEEGIDPAPMAGALTRAAIAKLCKDPGHTGSSTPMMGSSTPQFNAVGHDMGTGTPRMIPPLPHFEGSTTTRPGVSMQNYEGASNAAAVVEAIAQITDGYQKLLQASLSLLGL